MSYYKIMVGKEYQKNLIKNNLKEKQLKNYRCILELCKFNYERQLNKISFLDQKAYINTVIISIVLGIVFSVSIFKLEYIIEVLHLKFFHLSFIIFWLLSIIIFFVIFLLNINSIQLVKYEILNFDEILEKISDKDEFYVTVFLINYLISITNNNALMNKKKKGI